MSFANNVLILGNDEVSSDLAQRLSLSGYSTHLLAFTQTTEIPQQVDVVLVPEDYLSLSNVRPDLLDSLMSMNSNVEFVLFRARNGAHAHITPLAGIAYRSLAYPPDPSDIATLISHAVSHKNLKAQSAAHVALERLMGTSTLLHDGTGLKPVLQGVLQGIHSLGFDRVRLYLLSEDRSCIVGSAHIGMEGTEVPFIGLELPISVDQYLRQMLQIARPQIYRRDQLSPGVPYEKELGKEGVHEWLCAPLISQRQIIGKISADNKFSGAPLRPELLHPVALFAGQAAAAIENARLFEAVDRKAKEFEALRSITLAIASERDLARLLKLIINYAVELLHAKGGGIYKLLPERRELQIVAGYGASEKLIGTKLKLEEGAAGHLLSSGEPFLIISDYRAWQRRAAVFDQSSPFRSVLEVPLKWNTEPIGVIYVDDEVGVSFKKEDALLLKSFADQAAAALVNAELSESDARKLLRLEKLSQASSEIVRNPIMPREDRLNLIARYATEILNAETCGIFLAKNPNLLSLEASYGHRPGGFEKGRLFEVRAGYRTGLTSYIAAQRDIFSARGHELRDHFAVKGPESAHTPSGICFSLLAIPLRRRRAGSEDLIGLIRVDNKKDEVGLPNSDVGFSKEDEWVFRLFADSVLVTLDNADMIAKLNSQNDHWKRLVSSAPSCVLSVDEAGRVTGSNQQAEALLGFSETELVGRTVFDLYADYNEPKKIAQILDEQEDGRLRSYEAFVRHKTGTTIPIRLAATWLFDAEGKRVGSVGYFEDLRVEREAEERLSLLVEASANMARAKNLTDGLERVLHMLIRRLSVTFGRIFLTDYTGQYLITEAACSRDAGFSWQPSLKTRTAIADWPDLSAHLQHTRTLTLRSDNQQAILIDWSERLRLSTPIQWMLIVPLRVGERIIGLLDLGELRSWEEAPLSEDDKRLVVAVADQASVLIDRIRLQQEAELAGERLRLLYTASNELVSTQDPQQTIPFIVEEARKAANADGASMIIIDEIAQVRALITAGVDEGAIFPDLIRPNGLSMQIINTGTPEIVPDTSKDERVNPSAPNRGIRAALGLPVNLLGKRIGVMWFHYRQKTDFPKAETEALQLYVNQAATAYDSARRLSELDHVRQAAEALSHMSSAVELLEQVVRSSCGVLNSDWAAIWTIDPFEEVFAPAATIAYGTQPEAWTNLVSDSEAMRQVIHLIIDRGYLEIRDSYEARLELLDVLGERQPSRSSSLQGITLRSGQEHLGVLVITYATPRAFTKRERQIVETIANLAAPALRKARILDHLTRAREAVQIVAEATVVENLAETLAHSVNRTRVALGCTVVVLFTYSSQRGELGYPPFVRGPDEIAGLDRNAVLRDAFLQRVLAAREPVEDEGPQEDSPALTAILAACSVVSYVAVPLNAGGVCVGILLAGFKQRRHLSEDDQTDLRLLASQAAVAIRNRQLFNREQRRSRTLLALYKGVGAIMGTLSLPEILAEITQQAFNLIEPREGSSHFSYLGQVDEGVLRITEGYPLEAVADLLAHMNHNSIVNLANPDIKKGISGWVAATGESRLSNDVMKDEDYLCLCGTTQSQLSVAIKVDNIVRGVISVEHSGLNAFEPIDQYALESLAAFVAKYQQLSETKILLGARTTLAWSGLESRALFHEVRSKARTILGEAQDLQRTQKALTSQERLSLDAIISMADEISKAATAKPGSEIAEFADIDSLIRSRIEQRILTKPFRDIDFEQNLGIGAGFLVECDKHWLRHVLDILLDNAAEAMEKSAIKRIRIETTVDAGKMVLRVLDSGPGIAPDVRASLFKWPVLREGREGRGTGLLMAHAIVDGCKGEIGLDRATTVGGGFVVKLPREKRKRS